MEYCQQGVEDIVKVSHTVIWALVHFGTMVTSRATLTTEVLAANKIVPMDNTCLDRDTPLHEHACKRLDTSDGEDKEEEEQNQEGVLKKWDS